MKNLLLIRHAEAESPRATDDFDRPLSTRGKNDVQALAQKLQTNNFEPQLLVSSPALRTKTTAQILSDRLPGINVKLSQPIYEATEHTLLRVITQFADEYDFIALVGHNPGISYLLLNLTGQLREVPPCTAIRITFEVDEWQHISHDLGTITYYTSPQTFN